MARIAALLVATLVVAGCSSSAPPDQDPSGSTSPVSITVQVSGEREETAVYRAVKTAFENVNPQIEVELVEIADKGDHLTKLSTDFAAGDPADVFLVNFREYSQFVARGAVDPIEDYLDANDIDLAAYYPAPIEAFTFGDQLQCMPQNVSSLVVYYNTDLFEAAGLDAPQAGWTWDDFRATALELTGGDVRGVGIEANVIRVAPFVWSNGGELVDDDARPSRFTLDEPAAREALAFIVSLARDDEVIPTEEELAAQDLETRFVTDKLGMLLSSRRDTPAFREVRGLNWDVAPLPVADEPVGILHSDGYCIAAGTENPDAAAEFVAFATGNQGQTLTSLGGRTVPSMISVAESGAFLDPTRPPASSQVFLDAIPNLRRTPVIPTWPEIESLAEEILTRAFYEPGYTIDDALEALEAETAGLFEEGVGALP